MVLHRPLVKPEAAPGQMVMSWSGSDISSIQGKLCPSRRVRHAKIDGLIVLMDLEDEQYHILDERATVMWGEIVRANGDIGEAMTNAKMRLSGDPDRIERHFQSFVSQCAERGFLSPKQPAAAEQPAQTRPYRRRASWLRSRACWSLFRTAFSLKIRGFRRTYETAGTLRRSYFPVPAEPLLADAAQAFLWAENLVQFRKAPDDCVPRSLALFRFLRGIGLPVVHRIGGRRFPTFTMHAWVECDNKPILDDMLQVDKDVILASLPAE